MSEQSLTLYPISPVLLEQVQYREELLSGEYELDDAQRAAAVTEVEQYIVQLIGAEPAKIDNTAAFMRECLRREEVDSDEADRLYERSRMWRKRAAYVQERVVEIMQTIGAKKLEGQHSTLALRDNPAKVEVVQEALLPAEYQRTTVTLDQQTWEQIERTLGRVEPTLAQVLRMALANAKTEPKRAEIAKVLKSSEKCRKCGGAGETCPLGPSDAPMNKCEACKGSGSVPRGVPGARLVSGVRLEVK